MKKLMAMADAVNSLKSLNLANKLTILRILLTPLFVIALITDGIPHNLLVALIIFAAASITDFFDGYIARTRMMVTKLGKFLDPIADKILVMSALVCFAGMQPRPWISAWTVVVILARDFVVSAVRLAAVESEEKIVIPARTSGKVKTVITMVTICTILFLWILESYGIITYEVEFAMTVINSPDRLLVPIGNAFMYICVALTVFSGVQYLWDARDILRKVSENS
ncbi:MAG: CDP-diacylglycerol--glycerol-3-phosphate 3-phosphatidyltransferase [Oscillospiraceae bacterium]|nr:CDP-diacylglycerol--glycerol-3-phosphate 3-phosphatidyltransferase [Oscillospiraceae bacterium]